MLKPLYDSQEYYFKKLLREKPNDPVIFASLGKAILRRKYPEESVHQSKIKLKEAIQYYEGALALGLAESDELLHAETLDTLGHAYRGLEQFERAVDFYLEKIKYYPPQTFWARYFVGLIYCERLNKPYEAYEILKDAPHAIDCDPSYLHRVYSLLAALSFYFQNESDAKYFAKLALETGKNAKQTDRFMQRALALLALYAALENNFESSRQYIAQANELAASPDLNNCFLALAYVHGKKYEEAITIALSYNYHADWYYSFCLEALVRSYFAQGKHTAAQESLRRYFAFTDTLKLQNIFIRRTRLEFRQFLNELMKNE